MCVTVRLDAQPHASEWNHDAAWTRHNGASEGEVIFKVCAVKDFLERDALGLSEFHDSSSGISTVSPSLLAT